MRLLACHEICLAATCTLGEACRVYPNNRLRPSCCECQDSCRFLQLKDDIRRVGVHLGVLRHEQSFSAHHIKKVKTDSITVAGVL